MWRCRWIMKIITKLQKDGSLLIDANNRQKIYTKFGPGALFYTEIKKFKNNRSIREHRFYWATLKWCERNCPEGLSDILGYNVTDKIWHEIAKSKFNIKSTSFDELEENEFNKFFDDFLDWIATYIFKCDKIELQKEIRNILDE